MFERDSTAEEIYETTMDMVRRAHGIPPGEPIPDEILNAEGAE